MAIGSWPSRPRPGLGLDFGLIHFKSYSLILDIAHYKIVAVYKNVYRPSLIAFRFISWNQKICAAQPHFHEIKIKIYDVD